ncbi:MAG: metallophosphoesterase [Candidatus Obscuribacterales bacterium]|nr:metallophosphoesterase [Candidatus Obscuribacterales bacterium]
MKETDISKYFERTVSRRHLLLGLTSLAVLPFGQEAKAFSGFDPFSFGYVTGSYLITGQPDSYKLLQESQLFLQDAIKGLNAEKLDFVLFGGDNVEAPGNDDANWQLFLDIAQSLNCPWNFVIGEQDISGPQMADPMKTYGRDWKGKGIDRNVPYWSYDPMPGIHVVGLDTARRNSNTGYLGKEQLNWLKDDLKTNRHKFTIVASHHPLLPPAPFDGGSPWDDYDVPQGASAREIMGQYPSVRLALSGHVHINKIQQERSIWYVSSPSLAVYPCAYRIFRVTTDYVSVETYQISFPALIKKARQKVETWSLPYKYSAKVEAYTELMDGGKANQFARLPMAAGKPMEPLSAKKRKEPEKTAKTHKVQKGEKSEKNTGHDEKQSTTSDDSSSTTAAADEHKNMFGFGKKKKNKSEKVESEKKKKEDAEPSKKSDEAELKSKSETQAPDSGSPGSEKTMPDKTEPDKATDQAPDKTAKDQTENVDSKTDTSVTEPKAKPIPELLSAPDPKAKQQDKKHERTDK